MLLLHILIKILFKNFVYKQHRWPPPPPIAMPAMINWPKRLFFHQFLFLGLCSLWHETVKTFSFFFGSSPFFEKNSALQTVKPVLVVFCFGLYYISSGLAPPLYLKWSPTKFRPPPPPLIKTSEPDCEEFFSWCSPMWFVVWAAPNQKSWLRL